MVSDKRPDIRWKVPRQLSVSYMVRSLSALGKKLQPIINVKPELVLPWVKTTEIYIDITARSYPVPYSIPIAMVISLL